MFTSGFCYKNEGLLEADVRRLEWAEAKVQTRSLRFEGSVIREVGRPCVTSWPGKYEGAWERLVAESRQGQVSAAVVFLPDGTKDSGKHDRIPEEEGLLYGERKPWGCRWWTKWMANVELAVKSGAQLDVYFMKGQVGNGKVESFDTAGSEHLRKVSMASLANAVRIAPPATTKKLTACSWLGFPKKMRSFWKLRKAWGTRKKLRWPGSSGRATATAGSTSPRGSQRTAAKAMAML